MAADLSVSFTGLRFQNPFLLSSAPPTESESKASLDLFVATLRDLAFAVKRGDRARFIGAPFYAPRRRLDETRAARQPVLRWTGPAGQSESTE